jgi:hypothetical protein
MCVLSVRYNFNGCSKNSCESFVRLTTYAVALGSVNFRPRLFHHYWPLPFSTPGWKIQVSESHLNFGSVVFHAIILNVSNDVCDTQTFSKIIRVIVWVILIVTYKHKYKAPINWKVLQNEYNKWDDVLIIRWWFMRNLCWKWRLIFSSFYTCRYWIWRFPYCYIMLVEKPEWWRKNIWHDYLFVFLLFFLFVWLSNWFLIVSI